VLVDGLAACAAGGYASFPALARHHAARLLRTVLTVP
jgi:hypothetical protein